MASKIEQLTALQQKKNLLHKDQARVSLDVQDKPIVSNQKKLDKINADIQVANERIAKLVQGLYSAKATDPLSTLDESIPILMLPLRIETRFVGNELWVRVFPDEVAIQTHEAVLTASELEGGLFYWKTLWENSTMKKFGAFKKKTWGQIANHFGANRASWLIKQTRPLKFAQAGKDDFSTISIKQVGLDLAPDPSVRNTKAQAWSESVKCHLMPDLLKLKLYDSNGNVLHEVMGLPIPYPLPMSPDPQAPTSAPNTEMDWTGTNIEWLQDFDKAVSIGMGFKVDLDSKKIPAYNTAVGFSRLMVTGVRAAISLPHLDGRNAVNKLFESHLYSNKSLALIPQGTPTNNSEKRTSGLQEAGGFSEERYARENQPTFAGMTPLDKTDGQLFAEALALDLELLRTVEQSHNTDYIEAVQMNKALYPATLGFYAEHLLHTPSDKPVLMTSQLSYLRSFFCEYVTGRGALPAFRIGAQPYGLLPTSNFEQWNWIKQTSLFTPIEFVTLFQKLQQTLLEIQKQVHQLGVAKVGHIASGNDATDILHDILSLHPNSEMFFQRLGYSRNSINMGPKNTGPEFNIKLLTKIKLNNYPFGVPEGLLQLGKIVFENQAFALDLKNLVDIEAVNESTGIVIPQPTKAGEFPNNTNKQNYIGWLLKTYIRSGLTPTEINGVRRSYFQKNHGPDAPAPLLYPLLKHGLLLELYKCVYYWLERSQQLPKNFSLFKEFSQPLPDGSTPILNFIAAKEFFTKEKVIDQTTGLEKEIDKDITPMELLEYKQKGLWLASQSPFMSRYLLDNLEKITKDFQQAAPNTIPTNTFERLNEFFKALATLENLPTARLERCLVEHLDCLTYRLDAWQTGMFYQKLEENRKKIGNQSLYIGAFGWLENVKPKTGTIPATNLPASLVPPNGKPVVQADKSGGYIQTPSIGQAKAAALLRNAYLHHHDPAKPDLMAVNLTSDRVRKALQLFEGIQKGQPIEALLGYRFERGMHKIQLDKYIADFRRAFPLEAKSIPNPGSSEVSENKKTASVVDGLAMTKVVNDQDPFKNISLHAQDRPRIKAILDDLVDSVDAMQDLIVAESMYQLTRGNTDRAGALLKSIGEFKPPPVFEVVYTPRSAAHRVTHRICLVFEGELIQSGAYWSSSLVTPMASAESGLNKWLVQMIGDPYQIECTVQESHSDGSISYGSILLSYLPLQPIDLIALINKSSKAPDSALSKRVEYAYRKMNGVADNTPLMINYDQATAGKISFSDILPLLWRLKELIANARPLNASDFDLQNYPEHTNSGNYVTSMWGVNPDIGYLVRRRNAIKDALLSIQYDFYNLQEEDKLRAALLKLANYGYEAAFPKSAVANGEDSYLEIVNQAGAMFTMLNEKLAAFSATQNNTNVNDMSIEGQVKQLITEIKTLTGDTYQILPRFTFLGNEMIDRTAAINAAITNEGTLFKYVKMGAFNPKRYISNWFKSLTRVRPRIANLEMVNTLHNTFQNRNMEWHVAQMPWSLGDAWMALDLPPNLPPQTEKLSVLSNLSVSSNIANSQSTFCGLLLDEWVEEIPNKEETMGITFQHDQPNSQPPQTLLLAISPIDGGKWDWTKLEGILNDTFDRAKRRGVSTKDLINLDWFSLLPGVISEFSHSKANVSLFFGDLMK